MATSPSLRDLAKALGLSHTTFSEALRGTQRVKPATRERILAAAAAAGYKSNPLAGALMSEIRRARSGTFRGVIAVLDVVGPARRPVNAARYHHEFECGARERAEVLGFKTELFVLGERGVSVPRLDTILRSREIQFPISGARSGWRRNQGSGGLPRAASQTRTMVTFRLDSSR